MTTRGEALRKAMAQAKFSREAIDFANKEQAMAHNAFNDAVVAQPKKGRHSGTDLEDLRLHAVGAYEALLDALRIHSENLAHLAALKGKL
jgi:hypothetical protein